MELGDTSVERHGPGSQSHVAVGTSKPRAGAPEPGRRLGRAARPPAVSSAPGRRRERRAADGNRGDGHGRQGGRQPGRPGTVAGVIVGAYGKPGGETCFGGSSAEDTTFAVKRNKWRRVGTSC